MTEGRDARSFEETFGGAPELEAGAPGRVNLIGEHTDYHGGLVLPTVLPLTTRVLLRRRPGSHVRAMSKAASNEIATYEIGRERLTDSWVDYLQGATVLLGKRRITVPGFDLLVSSTIPIGAGVSSSAALVISVLRALRAAFRLDLDDFELAEIAHAVETDFVGAPVGIMDPLVCSVGKPGEALFIDAGALTWEALRLPTGLDLVVIDSGVPHRHASGEYIQRRRESFTAAGELGVERLGLLGVDALPRVEKLDPLLARRARHVITENQRVRDAVTAIRENTLVRLGELFNASHTSMRDDYEITTPDIDRLVALAQANPAVYGARMTGGGFGGAIVVLAAEGRGREAATDILGRYHRNGDRHGSVLVPTGISPPN